MNTYRSIFISDVHLGTRDCQAEKLNNFLKHNTCDTLYLVGDIIDAWKIQQNKWRWKQSHSNVVRRILGHAKRGTRVVYVAGNHDEFLRPMIPYGLSFGVIQICNQTEHIDANGKRFLVTHGDLFDGISKLAPWLTFLGDKLYDMVLNWNSTFNAFRRKFGLGYWSLSRFLKYKVKRASDFLLGFEKNISEYCKKKGYYNMENQLSKFSVTELKALVYDELAKSEQAQANIRILNQELRNRLQPPQGGLTNSDGSQPVVTQADFNPPTV